MHIAREQYRMMLCRHLARRRSCCRRPAAASPLPTASCSPACLHQPLQHQPSKTTVLQDPPVAKKSSVQYMSHVLMQYLHMLEARAQVLSLEQVVASQRRNKAAQLKAAGFHHHCRLWYVTRVVQANHSVRSWKRTKYSSGNT